ncbi:MAG TPA: DUF302 domain-containing protein [Anaerolineales bacterium]|jgi:uncharacterized protein (DUF302 family)
MSQPAHTGIGAFRIQLDIGFEHALERIKEALAAEGFGVLTEIDVTATLQRKLGQPFRRYTLLGACNPNLAHQALDQDLDVGLLLPCNIVAYELDSGGCQVAILDPIAMLSLSGNAALEPIAYQAWDHLARVAGALETAAVGRP